MESGGVFGVERLIFCNLMYCLRYLSTVNVQNSYDVLFFKVSCILSTVCQQRLQIDDVRDYQVY